MNDLFTQGSELLGIIAAGALALGAGSVPAGKWLIRRNQAAKTLEAIQNRNTNTNHINLGQDPVQMQLQRMERSIDHMEQMLITEGQIHHTQSSQLENLKNEISKLRDEIMELRISIGRNTA